MGLLKTLFKLTLLVVVGSVVSGVVFLAKKPKDESPISFEEWPSVPRNPAS